MTRTFTITAGEDRRSGIYQYYVDGEPTGIAAEPINAGTDSHSIATDCEPFIAQLADGEVISVDHDKDTIFVEVGP